MPQPLQRIGGASLNDVPDFERPIAAQTTLAPGGSVPGALAYVNQGSNMVHVQQPSAFTPAVLAHELTHRIQNEVGGATNPQAAGLRGMAQKAAYDFGGMGGLQKIAQGVKTIGNLNAEQQADIPRTYMNQFAALKNMPQRVAATEADKLNAAYGPAVRQLQNMAYPGPGINTTPAAPGPPPAALTGLVKPVDGMGGTSMTGSFGLSKVGR